jgi:hypothetical protein
MSTDSTRLGDDLATAAGYQRPGTDTSFVHGHGVLELFGPDGELKQRVPFTNLITQVGEQMYGERGGGVTSPPAAPTGMALGTGTTAVAKTGAGAALVTGTSASAVALDNSTPTSSIPGTVRRITYHTTWAAGTATVNGLAEVVLQNGTATTVPSNTVTTNIISRALLSPTVNKGASDSLAITWNHDIGT